MHIAAVTLNCVNVHSDKDGDCQLLAMDYFTGYSDFAEDNHNGLQSDESTMSTNNGTLSRRGC